MQRHIFTYLLLTLSLLACREEVEPQIVAGYIVETTSDERLIITNDSIERMIFTVNEATLQEGGTPIEGNIAEVIYLPATEEGELPYAERITTDKTYPQALGCWATEKDAPLKIEIELQPHGNISQNAPDQILHFERWQITEIENQIKLYGTLSLPPDWSAYNKTKAIDKDAPLPMRREQRFSVVALLDKETDSNTESRRVLIFKNNGRESKLYLQE